MKTDAGSGSYGPRLPDHEDSYTYMLARRWVNETCGTQPGDFYGATFDFADQLIPGGLRADDVVVDVGASSGEFLMNAALGRTDARLVAMRRKWRQAVQEIIAPFVAWCIDLNERELIRSGMDPEEASKQAAFEDVINRTLFVLRKRGEP